jgi:hypothetical protein
MSAVWSRTNAACSPFASFRTFAEDGRRSDKVSNCLKAASTFATSDPEEETAARYVLNQAKARALR